MPRYIPGATCWWPTAPSPQRIGAAPPDAQAVDGVCWPVHTGQGRDARRASLVERTVAKGSTTAHLRVVSKCALREGRQRERSAQVIPRRSRFGPLLLVDHRLSSLCHSATNEPQSTYSSGLVKPPFIHYIPEADFRGLRKKERLYQYPAFYR